MGTSDDERAFLEEVALTEDAEVCYLPTATDESIALLLAIRDTNSWVGSDRPDFYSDAHGFALEVMRVDDHPKVGRMTNPSLAREKKVEREIRAAFPSMGHDVRVVVTADTGLESEQDHNFEAYRQAFARVVVNHSHKVEAYRQHHPDYPLVLFIRDESSAYTQAEQPAVSPRSGDTIVGQPHYWFLDSYFTRIIALSMADFVIWSTPYKHVWHLDTFGRRAKLHLPSLAVYDIARISEVGRRLGLRAESHA
ncbi:MAG: hypothetical protein ACK5MR_08015 [Cumulibacter sp.]